MFGLQKKTYPARTHLSEKATKIIIIDKVHLENKCVDRLIVTGRRESFLLSSSIGFRPGFKVFKDPTSFLFY